MLKRLSHIIWGLGFFLFAATVYEGWQEFTTARRCGSLLESKANRESALNLPELKECSPQGSSSDCLDALLKQRAEGKPEIQPQSIPPWVVYAEQKCVDTTGNDDRPWVLPLVGCVLACAIAYVLGGLFWRTKAK